RGIGDTGAYLLAVEFFGWRNFKNRREVGALAGLTGTPFASGETNRDQGISKAGNPWVRTLMVELAWCWLAHQPNSKLSLWFRERVGKEGSRSKRKAIVAMARKLLVQLWQFVEHGVVPEGAVLSADSRPLASVA
ncbi:transposase, partial [bacterium]|nr:transposase [bacterium]